MRFEMKRETLEIKKLTKYINNSPAINNLSFILYEKEILGLSGKNSSGIPELINILTGKTKPDDGYIYLNSKKVLLNSNFDIQSSGITVISNDSMLFPNFSVEDNITVNWMTMKNKFIVHKKIFQAISRDILDKYNVLIDPKSKVKDLNLYEQTLLQILISYLHGAKVIILYDLIRSFTKPQWLNTLQLMNQLRHEGLSFIVISYDYRLLKICDRIMILRNGSIGGIFYKGEYNFGKMYKVLTQRSFKTPILSHQRYSDKIILSANSIYLSNDNSEINFKLHSGEIIGFITRENEPFYKIIQLLNGELDYIGNMNLSGKHIRITDRTSAFNCGICCAHKFSSKEYSFPNLSVAENILLLKYHDFSCAGILNMNMCRFAQKEYEKWFNKGSDVFNSDLSQITPQLQFYLFLNKWFVTKPRIILLDNIFSGADTDMQNTIYEFIDKAKSLGIGMIFYSTVLSDYHEICDTIYTI